jgi:PhzF family phenazine biosynthesis protein
MPIPLVTIDAFTSKPFSGNPAAVCLLNEWNSGNAEPRWPADVWLKQVAAEMNLSETAFTFRRGDGVWPLRWFTPAAEVDLCGHATLATAHAIWESSLSQPNETLRFETRSGILTAARSGDQIVLDFPVKVATRSEPPADLLESLNLTNTFSSVVYIGKNQFDYIVEVSLPQQVVDCQPDFGRLSKVACRGVILTAQSNDPNYDFISRFFAPAVAVNEDPVTGSAHCCLADHWSKKLQKDTMLGYQASSRGGFVHVTIKGDRVLLAGNAKTVLRGSLEVDPS